MLKRILTLSILKRTPSLTTGTLPTSKVIFRTLSQDIGTVDKWDLLSAVCLERQPVITKPLQDIQVRYQNMLQQIEFENSLISDFEIQIEKEEKQQPKIFTDDKVNIVSLQTTRDMLEMSEQELKNFKFASRISEAEEDNMVVSLKRKLDKNLVLLVEQSIGNCDYWIPPQSIRKPEETMIQSAHRTVQELCGNDIKVKFYGNAPIGFYQYMYPKNIRDKGCNGAKVFYFLAKYISGDISPNVKYCWLDREELKKTVHPNIHKSLSQFLLPD